MNRTGGKALLELVGLVGVLEDEGVEVLLAADLELDGLGLLVLLDASSCKFLLDIDSYMQISLVVAMLVSNRFAASSRLVYPG